jgi:hypothetical protein
LVTNAIDLDAVLLAEPDNARGALVLGSEVRQVVVVVVELRCGVGGRGDAEGNRDVGLADDAEEDVVAVGVVLVES